MPSTPIKPKLRQGVRVAFGAELERLARGAELQDVDIGEHFVRLGLEALGYPGRNVFNYRLKREKRRTDTA
jgi:hypothetical protein